MTPDINAIYVIDHDPAVHAPLSSLLRESLKNVRLFSYSGCATAKSNRLAETLKPESARSDGGSQVSISVVSIRLLSTYRWPRMTAAIPV
jgi:hypothetical protein